MDKQCGCKGIRSCLLCECSENQIVSNNCTLRKQIKEFVYCSTCGKAWILCDSNATVSHPATCVGESVDFFGVEILLDFISESEEQYLVEKINLCEWRVSQSGRQKQDYGPKVNFKKQKIGMTSFLGLPSYSRFILDRFKKLDRLCDFAAVELCNLEYVPERGSAIDPHLDDSWLWGERLVTLNLLSDVILTFTKVDNSCTSDCQILVGVKLPRRSLVIVSGPARHQWMHAIRRGDVYARRIAMTFRELSPEFCAGGASEQIGDQLARLASVFID